MDAVTQVPTPVNEPVHGYAPGSPERARLEAKLKELADNPIDLPCTIGGEKRMGGGERFDVVQPHNHKSRLGTYANATQADAQDAIDAALAAAPAWRAMSFDDRAAIILRAAELLSGPWRETIAASTMLGQSKTAQQAEIDSPCELIDFWRFNVHYARNILAEQPPANSQGVWNRMDHRPLEGFVYAITPFNFSAIAANLPTAPALMGNVVVWKPSPTQTHAAVLLMQLLEEAGLPKGVINLVTGDGIAVSEVALEHRDLAGIHFTGSTKTFQHLWKTVGNNIEVPHLPAPGRRDRRQGLPGRPPERRPRRPQDGPDPRCLRVPGPEVQRHLPRVHPGVDLERRVQGGVRRRGRLPHHG